ncbi:MAG: hypothetical protein HY609_00740, partial [Deltaproteobacteria bacterium]|nr:hypothetical protein [Deltaproteobacteria bacterium]
MLFCIPKTAWAAACPENIDDEIDCTFDSCDSKTGNVTHTPDHRRCDDANVCTANVCTAGGCRFDPMTESELDDGNACTRDICDSKEGILHPPVAVDDRNVCTIDSCDPVSGVQHAYLDERVGTACSEGIGACFAEGTWACDAATGAVSCTARAGAPRAEVCNQIDDNCDGNVDNVARLGEICTEGSEQCLVTGVLECKPDGILACSVVAGDGSEERCDGIDNDCDGRTDEDLARGCYEGPSYAVSVGICTEGRQTCDAGEWSACSGAVLPAASEICGNDLDDNCDGTADENCERESLAGDAEPEPEATAPKTVTTEAAGEKAEAAVPSAGTTKVSEPEVQTTDIKTAVKTAEPVFVFQQPVSTTTAKTTTTTTATKTTATAVKTADVAVKTTTDTKTATVADTTLKTTTETVTKEPAAAETVKTTEEPEKVTEEVEKTADEPAPVDIESQCRSSIFDCSHSVAVQPPCKDRDAVGVLYPSDVQDASLFDKQILLVACHTDANPVLAYLPVREFSADRAFGFHNIPLAERWKHLEVAALEGGEKNDLIAVSQLLHYVLVHDLDQVLRESEGRGGELWPDPLFDFGKGAVTQRSWEDEGSARNGELAEIYALKAVPLSEGGVGIFGVVELET